ncbi:MAG: hypothetical protein HY685_00465 [Chloroflexi bacterium]|nr:hypothetical protein [Chloroflexota bacterium]
MPVYEYTCGSCRRHLTLFFRTFSAAEGGASCPHCGGKELNRHISRIAVLRSDQELTRGYDQMSWMDDLNPDEPKDMQKMAESLGEERAARHFAGGGKGTMEEISHLMGPDEGDDDGGLGL